MLDAKLLKPSWKRGQLTGPVEYQDFRETAPRNHVGTLSPRNFEVQVGDIIWKWHLEQLLPRFIPSTLRVSSWTPATWANWRVDPSNEGKVTLSQSKEAMPVFDTPAMDSMAHASSSPQDSSLRDSELQVSTPEQPERKPPQRFY